MKTCCRRISPEPGQSIAFERDGLWRVGTITHVGLDAIVADMYPFWPKGFVRPAGPQSTVLYRSRTHSHPLPRAAYMAGRADWHAG